MAGRRPVSRRDRRAGYSLIEVLFVITIFAILAALTAPALQARDEVSSEVRRVVADATRIRSWARTTWRVASLDVDIGNRRWRLIDETGEILDSNSADANGWRSLATGVDFASVAGVPADLTFDPDGRGTENAAVRLTSGDSTWLISLDALTGAVTATAE